MARRYLLLALLSTLLYFMAGCRDCGEEVYLTGPDLPPNRAMAIYQAQGGDIPVEEIKTGSGRMAQPGRKFSFQVGP
jgi:hypothetical protein